MTAFLYHLNYDFRTGLRDKTQMLMYYLFPLFFYAMMGMLMGQVNPGFLTTMIPAMIVFAGMSSTLLALPGPVVSARENGVYRSYRINGVPAINIVLIPILGTMLHMTVCAAIIALTAKPLFGAGLPLAGHELAGVGIFFAMAFCLAALGMLIGVISSSSRATVLLGQALYLPSIMLSGMMIPLGMLPKGLAPVALLFPATHMMEAFRGAVMGLPTTTDPWLATVALLASGAIALGLSVHLFDWDSKPTGKPRARFLALLALLPFAVAALIYAL
ncbi:ABC-type multidrug transport system, permease component [Longilinea arvoryzae]|uniref:Transport permease protein n=1 Tax=Longilinea arvoryzae TaxID=360412 RepID=A0A0S7BKE3_9CHLR|nr:ABC transporter permease [Longilinea arvoryzae]GAP14122.1 ABC-type multidrug transport system, permease component [Longilinea arvoryzae]